MHEMFNHKSILFFDVNLKISIFIFISKYIESCLNESINIANKKTTTNENNNCGIVYCRSRDACVQLAGRLISKNISAKAYHAGLKNTERDEIQNEWF